jgi:FkbM family methyltransferase
MFQIKNRMAKLLHIFSSGKKEIMFRNMKVQNDPSTDIGYQLAKNGTFEDKEIDISCALYLSRHPDANADIVDIGANIGLHSMVYASLFPGAMILAFEPSSKTRVILNSNIKNNDLHNISVFPCAISDINGVVDFYETSDNAYNSLKDTRRKPIQSMTKVECARLDDLLTAQQRKIGMIKIDVEGFEAQVIKGAIKTISQMKPILFLEIYKGTASNQEPEKTIQTIVSLGYSAFVYSASGLIKFESHHDENYNYFFIPN